jgi:competence protein ComEA
MFSKLIALVATCFALNAFAAVDANQASRAELETVKGIGPGLSAKIMKARETGTFKNWDDLVERVGGVGPGNAARFSQAGLTVQGVAYDGKPVEGKAAKPAKEAKDTAKEPKKARTPKDRAKEAAKSDA